MLAGLNAWILRTGIITVADMPIYYYPATYLLHKICRVIHKSILTLCHLKRETKNFMLRQNLRNYQHFSQIKRLFIVKMNRRFMYLLPWKDSNSHKRNQNPVCYHYTTRQFFRRLYCRSVTTFPFWHCKISAILRIHQIFSELFSKKISLFSYLLIFQLFPQAIFY